MSEAGVPGLSGETRPTVLVTGAAGFLGSRVVELLSRSGRCDVLATDVEESARLASLARVRFRSADLRDGGAMENLLRGADYVVHLAALRSRASETGERSALDVNVGTTYDLLRFAARHHVRGLVYGSSHLVYGPFHEPDRRPFLEDEAAVRPGLSLYAAAKLASEAFVEALSRPSGITYLCLRFGGIYGPQAAPGSNSSAMLDVLDALDRGLPPVVRWSRDSVHALIYVDDAARAVVRALEFPIRDTAVNVVAAPQPCEVVYSTLVRLYGVDDPRALTWQDRVRYQFVSGERLVRELGCPPATTLEQGLRSIVEWRRRRA